MPSSDARDAFSQIAARPAVVTIDLHRGHLDPAIATLPLRAEAAAALMRRVVPRLDAYRELGLAVIHVVTAYRAVCEIVSNPYWRFQAERPGSARQAIVKHNLDGMPGLELMPGVLCPGDAVVRTKKRYDSFVGTDLELMLRSGGHDALLLLGVNTNSCVLATAIAASVRDFAVFLVEDCIDTMESRELHEAAKQVFGAAFGWLIDGSTCLDILRGRAPVAVGHDGASRDASV